MRKTTIIGFGLIGLGALAAAACSDGTAESSEPQKPEDFTGTIEQELAAIDAALTRDPNDAAARAWARRFNEKSEERMGAFHTIDMGGGRIVKLYQPRTGGRAMSETGPLGSTRSLPRGAGNMSFAEVFSHLRPHEQVPAVILDADARLKERMLGQSEQQTLLPGPGTAAKNSVDTADTGLISKHATSDCAHFQDDHGCYTGDRDDCLCNKTGGGGNSYNGIGHSYHTVAAYRGAVSIEYTYDNRVFVGPLVIEQGVWRWQTIDSGMCSDCGGTWVACGPDHVCPREHGHRVYNASGDGYHRHYCMEVPDTGNPCD